MTDSRLRLALRRAFAVLLLGLVAPLAAAQAPARADLYLFWAESCPHCADQIAFLKRLEGREPRLRVHYLEVSRDRRNQKAFAAVVEHIGLQEPAVPLTVVGEAVMVGYESDATSGQALAHRVDECLAKPCADIVGPLLQAAAATDPAATPSAPLSHAASGVERVIAPTFKVPFLGEMRTADVSLPVLTLVLGALDGFNPCAMWVLVFLIGLLVGMQDRFRMWTLGTAFIAGSALVYFLFMAAWLNFLLFVGAVAWVRAAVGLVALGGGFYYLREYWRNPDAVCEITAPAARRRVLERLRGLAAERRFWVALAGILALAFAVNLVELLCSAGIPAVYTQVLALSDLPAWQYYAYLALYIFVFMLDDLFVFVVAMKTLQVTGVTTRYARFSRLAGGAVLLAIGALLLLRPEWLMFG
jgi:hypothetical protein